MIGNGRCQVALSYSLGKTFTKFCGFIKHCVNYPYRVFPTGNDEANRNHCKQYENIHASSVARTS